MLSVRRRLLGWRGDYDMQKLFAGLAAAVLVAACSKSPTAAVRAGSAAPPAGPAPAAGAAVTPPLAAAPVANGPPVSGVYTANGKPAALTAVSAHKDEPFDGTPVTDLVFTARDQGGDDKAADDAIFGKFGDAIVIKAEPDGTVIGADILHAGLEHPSASVSMSGVLSLKDYRAGGGQISGHLTSGGPTDVFGQKVDIDLTFHTKAP